MSTLKVEIVEILESSKHPNADKLSIYKVLGWNVIAGLNQFKVGDKVVYFPIDSLLPQEVEAKIFGPDSKIKLHHSRVKTIKLRGAISQGLIVHPETVGVSDASLGDDLTKDLGIKKYEPPVNLPSGFGNTRVQVRKKQINPHFHKYTDIENAKNYPSLFEEGELVAVTEKIHGSNFRCGYVPFNADTIIKKIKKFFGFAPKFEFVYGSHNVQLQNKVFYDGYYDSNVYAETVKKYNLQTILQEGEVIYGEIYGEGIQKGYTYGCNPGEQKFVAFDIMKDGKYLDAPDFQATCLQKIIPTVPVVYRGPFNLNEIKKLVDGDSVLAPIQKIREGIVVKPIKESLTYMGRKVLKLVSDAYLLGDQSEFH